MSIIVSVIMPVYNREKFIQETIESILNQTYTDFELIIVDDGSSDKTKAIIKSIDDSRIVLVEHNEKRGVATARNTGYSKAKGKYIAISDSDDINLPDRLEKQLHFLERHLDIDVVSCWVKEFGENQQDTIIKFSSNNDIIRANQIFNPGIPAFMMFRKDKVEKHNCLYHDESFEAAVDYEWYSSLHPDIKMSCISEPLYLYRRHQNQISTNGFSKQQLYANKIRKKELAKIGIVPSDEEMKLHYFLSFVSFASIEEINFSHLFDWCAKLIHANKQYNYYNQLEFEKNVLSKLYSLTEKADIYKKKLFDQFCGKFGESPVFPHFKIDINQVIKKMKINGKKTMVFGTKRLGYLVKKELEHNGELISAFLDNKEGVANKELDGVIIQNPSKIKNELISFNILITVISEHRFTIKNKLIKEYGLKENQIFTIEDFIVGN